MIDRAYFIFTCLSIGITLGLGCCFLILKTPDIETLKCYRKARRTMAIAYISMSLLLCIEILSQPSSPYIRLTQSATLIVSAIQAFLFTYTFICLINIQFVSKKKILFESISILTMCCVMIGALFYAEATPTLFNFAFYLCLFYYFSMLVRYTILFIKEYRLYILQIDNFFSDEDSTSSRWVYYSFLASLAIGSGALLVSFSTSTIHYTIFSLVFIVFYCYFGIKFIEYPYSFYRIEPILTEREVPPITFTHHPSKPQLTDKISEWIKEEKFLQSGITVKHLAEEFNTNRTYLSNYINHTENKVFREWINDLRIEKSKEILLSSPDLPISEIATISGYTDPSNFNRQFVKNTGISANAWRMQRINK